MKNKLKNKYVFIISISCFYNTYILTINNYFQNFKKKRRSEIIISYSNNRKITKLIKWKPKFNNLDIMVKNSLSWEKKVIRTKNLILND